MIQMSLVAVKLNQIIGVSSFHFFICCTFAVFEWYTTAASIQAPQITILRIGQSKEDASV